MINYLDRTVLGVAAPSLTRDLGLTPAQMGLVFSAFSWSYALLQIPGGIFLDRFGTRVTYFIAVVFWSVCTAAMGLVRTLNALILTRIGVGVFEAPCFPANSRILATWFPQQERARANSIYSFGQYVGLGFLSVPLFWITAAVWLARPVLRGRRLRRRVRPCLVGSVSRSGGEPRGEPRRSSNTSKQEAAANTKASRSDSGGATSRRCCGTGRSWAPRSASSAATRRRCSSSPGFPPTS